MAALRISVETLCAWLESGQAVTILDVRPGAAYAAWSIPGSRHIEAYEALKAGQTGGLESLELPGERPIVVVCQSGQVSQRAAAILAARGLPAYSLEGGMRAWSLAWNTALVPLPCSSGPTQPGPGKEEERRQVIQIRRTGKGCLSYLISDGAVALVLDPSLEPAVYLQQARRRGWQIVAVLETHIHADHLSRARLLAEASGARLLLPAQRRVAFPFQPLADGERLALGRLELQALHTPGAPPVHPRTHAREHLLSPVRSGGGAGPALQRRHPLSRGAGASGPGCRRPGGPAPRRPALRQPAAPAQPARGNLAAGRPQSAPAALRRPARPDDPGSRARLAGAAAGLARCLPGPAPQSPAGAAGPLPGDHRRQRKRPLARRRR
ncbi:rhodanese-like domain-containing protein [Thermogemmatispora sp.]|uniref:rhodanese-like domain-containing protein n=1 Tax=Thermogemmatispora sp. TaxID=1968838 RepID=UPI0035E42C14